MARDEIPEDPRIRRFGQIRRKTEEPAEFATRRPEPLARSIEKEEDEAGYEHGTKEPTESGVGARRHRNR